MTQVKPIDRVTDLTAQLGELRKVIIEQQKELAEVKEQHRALIQ